MPNKNNHLTQAADGGSRSQTFTIQQALDLAVKQHSAGELSKAEDIYNQILQADPNQPQALHLLFAETLFPDDELLDEYSCDGFSQSLKQIIELESPKYVVMAHTYMVRDLLPTQYNHS